MEIKMEMTAACYWQQGDNASSLLLQQYRCGQLPVQLACVCGGNNEQEGAAGGRLTGRLLEWLRNRSLPRKSAEAEAWLGQQKPALERLLSQTETELSDARTSVAGVLTAGTGSLVFCRGSVSCCLLNRSLGRSSLKEIFPKERENGALQLGLAAHEPHTGLLIMTESFKTGTGTAVLQEALPVREVTEERQLEKRLRELGRLGEEAGCRNMAAVLCMYR